MYIEEIEYLKSKYPDGVVFPSIDKDYICVRTVLCSGTKIEGLPVPITKTTKYHVDTVRLSKLQSVLND